MATRYLEVVAGTSDARCPITTANPNMQPFYIDSTNNYDVTFMKNGVLAVQLDSLSPQYSGGNAQGGAGVLYTTLPKTITAITDDTAKTIFTVSIPNPTTYHSAVIDLTVLGIAGAGGAIGAGESCSAVFYQIVVTRTVGVAAVAGISTATSAVGAASAVSGGDQIVSPLLVTLGAITGGATALETFTIQVTIDDDTGSATNHVAIGYATVLNALAGGVTIA